jgi:uncharacterized protein YbjT (DUF2867 family)
LHVEGGRSNLIAELSGYRPSVSDEGGLEMRILVTGGTGHLGRAFVAQAGKDGHSVRVLSRRPASSSSGEHLQGDLGTGAGVSEAVSGMDAIVHAASDPVNTRAADVQGTARLLQAARSAGIGHLVFVSIVGIDRIPLTYYGHKLAAERLILASGVPCSILRAAQFHYFVDFLLGQAARVPFVLPVPRGFRVQSIGTADVARELSSVLARGPSGLLPDLVGPEAVPVTSAARKWLRARGMRRLVVSVPIWGKTAAGFRAGYNTVPERPSGTETWEAWLERRYGAAS